jgi:hypothetical protein
VTVHGAFRLINSFFQSLLASALTWNPQQINVIFIVLDIGKPNSTKDGHMVRRVKVADKTGSIDLSVWDEYGAVMQTGDICKILKGRFQDQADGLLSLSYSSFHLLCSGHRPPSWPVSCSTAVGTDRLTRRAYRTDLELIFLIRLIL